MELLFFFFVALFLRLKDILYIVYLNKKKNAMFTVVLTGKKN